MRRTLSGSLEHLAPAALLRLVSATSPSGVLEIDTADELIAPAGNELTIRPSTAPLGQVKNPNENYTAVLYGKHGLIRIKGTKDQPVPLPEGDWKLLSYVIDLTDGDGGAGGGGN